MPVEQIKRNLQHLIPYGEIRNYASAMKGQYLQCTNNIRFTDNNSYQGDVIKYILMFIKKKN